MDFFFLKKKSTSYTSHEKTVAVDFIILVNSRITFMDVYFYVTEIANLLHRFLTMYREGNVGEYEAAYNSLPVGQLVLSKSAVSHASAGALLGETETRKVPIRETPMEEEDPEWTQVRRHKR